MKDSQKTGESPDAKSSRLSHARIRGSAAEPGGLRSRLSMAFWVIGILGVAGVVVWSFAGVGLSIPYLLEHVRQGGEVLKEFIPQNRHQWREWVQTWRDEFQPTISTFQMAVAGTLMGACGALPISFFAARTTSLHRLLSSVIKTAMNVTRAVPILIYAVILASMIGLGPQTGVLAIAVGSFVMLTKLYAESLESLSPGPVEAVRAAGGNVVQTFVYGMLPQVFPSYVASTLYAFELNLQASFILGFVGAGGIGTDLLNYTHLFEWRQVSAILFITIVVVNLVDFISYRIRSAIS